MSELNETGNSQPPPGREREVAAEYWYWGGISSAQLLWAISSFRKGYSGDGRLMPFKAFAVASLFVGATASATIGCLRASGIHSVEDMKMLGANIRAGLKISRRAEDD